jgi:hypothetical protein
MPNEQEPLQQPDERTLTMYEMLWGEPYDWAEGFDDKGHDTPTIEKSK